MWVVVSSKTLKLRLILHSGSISSFRAMTNSWLTRPLIVKGHNTKRQQKHNLICILHNRHSIFKVYKLIFKKNKEKNPFRRSYASLLLVSGALTWLVRMKILVIYTILVIFWFWFSCFPKLCCIAVPFWFVYRNWQWFWIHFTKRYFKLDCNCMGKIFRRWNYCYFSLINFVINSCSVLSIFSF